MRARHHSLLLFGLVAAQLLVFRQYVLREVAWAYPGSFDQASYLRETYTLFLRSLESGPGTALTRFLGEGKPQGIMLPIQAALMQSAFGSNRLAALLLNFGYLTLLEVTLFATATWLTGRAACGWMAVGLLLLQQSGLNLVGGMFDFRIDFIASCLYGILFCLLLRSNGLRETSWLVWAAVCAWLLVSFRFITFVYLTGTFGLLVVALGVGWFRDPRRSGLGGPPLIRSTTARAIVLACACLGPVLPLLLLNWQAIKGYYVVGHLTSGEKSVRAKEFGANTAADHLLFYVRSLVNEHLGTPFLMAWVAALAVAGFVLVRRRRAAGDRIAGPASPGETRGFNLLLLALVLFAPWLILTVNISKSPVVGSVFAPPLALLPFILLGRAGSLAGSRAGRPEWGRPAAAVAVGLTLLGVGHWFAGLSTQGAYSRRRDSVEEINTLYDVIARESQRIGAAAPVVSADMLLDWTSSLTFTVHHYERHGRWVDAPTALNSGIMPVSRERAMSDLGRSDLVLLSSYPKAGVYPFFESMRLLEPEMRAWCEANLLRLQEFPIDAGVVTLYGRFRVNVKGLSGGWITPGGVRLELPPSVVQRLRRGDHHSLVMEGASHLAWLPRTPTAAARVGRTGDARDGEPDDGVRVPAVFEAVAPERYRVRVELNGFLPSDADRTGAVVNLRLDGAQFVPKEAGINEDTRELVVQGPTQFHAE